MIKTKKINKLILVLTLALAFALCLVIVSSATTFVITSPINAPDGGTFASGGYYPVNYGNIENGNFSYININGDNNYTFVLFDIEAFKIRYNGYTAEQFESELDTQMNSGNNDVASMYYSFFYDNTRYGFPSYGTMFYHVMSWTAPPSQEQFERLEQEYSTLEQTYKQLVISNNTLQSNYNTLQGDYNTLQSDYNTLQSDYTRLGTLLDNTVSQYNALQSQYNQLESSIPEKEENARQLGYQQGYNAADDFWLPVYQELENDYNTLNVENQQLKLDIKDSYNLGYSAGMTDGEHFEEGITSILSAPMYFLGNVLQFDVFGINVFSVVCSIFTLLIIAFVIKKLSN